MSEWLRAIVKQKCPICYRGSVFRSGIAINENCPACGLKFEREQGYWLGALYVAYGLAVPVLSILTLVIWLLADTTVGRSFLIAIILFLPMSPWTLRYARVIWLHLDQLIDPRPASD